MDDRLSSHESAHEGVTRVLLQEVGAALGEARDPSLALESAVHAVRKRCKRARAALRLYPGPGPAFERQNRLLRDAGRFVAPLRDSDAVLQTLERLVEETGVSTDRAWALARGRLEARRAIIREKHESGLARLVSALEDVREQGWNQSLDPSGPEALADGYERGYRRGRRGYRRVVRRPTGHRYHEWRKEVKYHWCHVCLLETTSPGWLGRRGHHLESLSELLGMEHDLVVFESVLPELELPARIEGDLRGALEISRERLRSEALALGGRLFVSRPNRVGRAMRGRLAGWVEPTAPEAPSGSG